MKDKYLYVEPTGNQNYVIVGKAAENLDLESAIIGGLPEGTLKLTGAICLEGARLDDQKTKALKGNLNAAELYVLRMKTMSPEVGEINILPELAIREGSYKSVADVTAVVEAESKRLDEAVVTVVLG